MHIHLLNAVVQFIVFLTLSTLICRGTEISKCFSESLGIRDNESRLYCKDPAPTVRMNMHMLIWNFGGDVFLDAVSYFM